jgi:hypothetical protein
MRLEFPAGADLERAWAAARAAGSSPASAGLWEANGMRAEVVGLDHLKDVSDALPPPLTQQDSRIVPGPQLLPWLSGWAVTQPLNLRLTLAVGEQTTEQFERGRFQLLARFGSAPPGLIVELIPQLNDPRYSIVPRMLLEKQLEGRRFDPLTLGVHLIPRQVLLLGVTTEPAPAFASANRPLIVGQPRLTTTQPGKTPPPPGPIAGTAEARPTRVIVRDLLGSALLTGSSPAYPQQVLVVLAVEPRWAPARTPPK